MSNDPGNEAKPGTAGRARLFVAVALFVGWLAWLGYAAVRKSHDPIVSHVQAAVATAVVVAQIDGPGTNATVAEKLWGDAPDGAITVVNLPDAQGLGEPGKYLLYLIPYGDGAWRVVGQQRSPGNDQTGLGKPLVYAWTDDVRKQAEKLLPAGNN